VTELPLLVELGYVVGAATAALVAARSVRLPPIVGYLLAGLVLGPATGVLSVSHSVELFSELGVALLLFLVGLELSVDRIREMGGTAVTVGAAQMAATCVLGGGIALAFGFGPTQALFLGLAVTFSSTVVVVKLLDEAGALDERYGRLSIGVLLVQDVAVALVLTLVSGLGGGTSGDGLVPVARGLAGALAGLALLVAAAAAAVRWGLSRLLAWLDDAPDGLFVTSLAWCLGFILAAEALHLSVELGAFVAGVALAQLPQAHELADRVRPLVDFFVAVFFVALGAGLDLGAAAAQWAPALALSGFVLLGKPVIVGGLLGGTGHSDRTGLLAGLTLGQISEFAFVLLGTAVAAGIVEEELLSLVGLVGLVTIGASAAVAPLGERLHAKLRGGRLLRVFGRPAGEEEDRPGPAGHVVVVGMNALGRALVRRLRERGEAVVAVDSDRDKLAGLGVETVAGDVNRPAVLEQVGIPRAKLVVSALRIQDANSLLAHRCRRLGVPVSVNAFDPSVREELAEIGVDHLMDPKHEAVRQLEEELRAAGALGR
jgi:Kef-type K+ transport system membrane component KefB